MKKTMIFVYGVASYLLFLAVFLYAIGFIGNFAVPKTLDSAAPGPWHTSLLIDLGLLSLFAVQHSVMARPWFKRMLTTVVPEAAERSTYVLASSLALLFLFWKWQPLGGVVWEVEAPMVRVAVYGLYAAGWALVLLSTFVINHFDLFGLRQVWRALQGLPQSKTPFVVPVLYRIVRHPLYVGWFLTFWSAPTMTVTHLVFAVITSAYILVAIQFEEADLMKAHPEYVAYREQVPMLVPGLPRDVLIPQANQEKGPQPA
ncbi:MAG: isoprenylcysteine carboxylmethyltransferase family protein [Acidobacteria bacterium]|nr:isoprenylcysteine carboxylmethyltransferase family protein [Acidobacteriota bacterium]